jgi:hypothetical protein
MPFLKNQESVSNRCALIFASRAQAGSNKHRLFALIKACPDFSGKKVGKENLLRKNFIPAHNLAQTPTPKESYGKGVCPMSRERGKKIK